MLSIFSQNLIESLSNFVLIATFNRQARKLLINPNINRRSSPDSIYSISANVESMFVGDDLSILDKSARSYTFILSVLDLSKSILESVLFR